MFVWLSHRSCSGEGKGAVIKKWWAAELWRLQTLFGGIVSLFRCQISSAETLALRAQPSDLRKRPYLPTTSLLFELDDWVAGSQYSVSSAPDEN